MLLQFDDVNSMDETSSRQPFCLNSLITEDSIVSLGTGLSSNTSFAEYFSGIRNLQITDISLHTTTLGFGWDVILLASQTLTTLDFFGECQFCFEIASRLWCAHDKIIPIYSDLSLEDFPFDLARFPALRHFKVGLPNYCDLPTLPLLSQLLFISSSSGIEILVTWYNFEIVEIVGLFTLSPEWVTLEGFYLVRSLFP